MATDVAITIIRHAVFDDWFRRVRDVRGKGAINTRLVRLSLGNFGDHKALGEGLHELRFHSSPGCRLYFVRVGERVVLLLAGGDKDEQNDDIARPRRMIADGEVEQWIRGRSGTP